MHGRHGNYRMEYIMRCTKCHTVTVTMRNEYGDVCKDCHRYLAGRKAELAELAWAVFLSRHEFDYAELLAQWEADTTHYGIYIPEID